MITSLLDDVIKIVLCYRDEIISNLNKKMPYF